MEDFKFTLTGDNTFHLNEERFGHCVRQGAHWVILPDSPNLDLELPEGESPEECLEILEDHAEQIRYYRMIGKLRRSMVRDTGSLEDVFFPDEQLLGREFTIDRRDAEDLRDLANRVQF